MRSAVTSGFQAVLSTVRSLPASIRSVFSNAGSLLVNAGRNIIQGLTRGIRNAIGGAVDAVRGGVQRIRNLLPFSPAKDGPLSGSGYTLFSGQALMGDFGKGISQSSAGAVAAARSVTDEVAEAMASQVEIPDYLPDSWTAGSLPGVAHVPSSVHEPASSSGGGRTLPPLEITVNANGTDPNVVAKKVKDEFAVWLRGQGVPVGTYS